MQQTRTLQSLVEDQNTGRGRVRRNTSAVLLSVLVSLCFCVDGWAQGCALCRAALESSPEGKVLAASLAHGILMMLILPYGLLATFGFIIYRAYRKKSKERQKDPYSYQAESGR